MKNIPARPAYRDRTVVEHRRAAIIRRLATTPTMASVLAELVWGDHTNASSPIWSASEFREGRR